MESKYNIAVFALAVVIVASLGVLIFSGEKGVTGHAIIGDNTNNYCNYTVNEDTNLSGDIVGCTNYGLIINASNIVLDCNDYRITFSGTPDYSGGDFGITSENVTNVTVRNCNVNGFFYDFYVYNTSGGLFFNNSAANGSAGFDIEDSFNISFDSNRVYDSEVEGFYVYQGSNLSFINNHAFSNEYGMYFDSPNDYYYFGNVFYNNGKDMEFSMNNGNFFSIINNSFLPPSGIWENYTVLSVDDSASDHNEYFINWSGVPSLPGTNASFGNKFVSINTVFGSPSLEYVEWSWNDSESFSMDESIFNLYVLNSSGWFVLNDTPDVSNNILSVSNLVPSSTYGILFAPIASPNIELWDSTDSTAAYIFDEITFYANITDSETGNPVDYAEVKIYKDVFPALAYDMVYNSTSQLWEFQISDYLVPYNGTFDYNVTATSALSFSITEEDNYTVNYSCLNFSKVGDHMTYPAIQDAVMCEGTSFENSTVQFVANYIISADFYVSNIIFDCNGTLSSLESSIYLRNAQNITLKNCNFQDSVSTIIRAENISGLNILNFSTVNTSDSNITIFSIYDSRNILIENSNLSETGMDLDNKKGLGVYFSGNNNNLTIKDSVMSKILFNNANNVLFENLTASGSSVLVGSHWEIFDTSYKIENMTVRNSHFKDAAASAFWMKHMKNFKVYNNVFENVSLSVYFPLIASVFGRYDFNDSFIYNNTFDVCFAAISVPGHRNKFFNNTLNCYVSASSGERGFSELAVYNNRFEGFTYFTVPQPIAAGGLILAQNENVSLLFENNTLQDSGVSVLWDVEKSNVTIRNNIFNNSPSYAIMLLNSSANLVLRNNTFLNSNYALYSTNSNLTGFSGNTFDSFNSAFYVYDTVPGYSVSGLANNTMTNVDYGIFVENSQELLLKNNRIESVNGYDIYLSNSNSINVSGNLLKGMNNLYIASSDLSAIWNNSFFTGGATDAGTNSAFCINNIGNFYEQSLTPVLGDCGQINLTNTIFAGNVITFIRQSSPIQPVNYEVYRNASGTLVSVSNVSSSSSPISVNWPSNIKIQNMVIIPWVNGSRINGTWFIGNFTLLAISGLSVSPITSTSATVKWTTDELMNSSLNYGTTLALGTVVDVASPVLAHSVLLSGLQPKTLYYYNITICDSVGNCATSGTYSFTTSATPSTTPSGPARTGGGGGTSVNVPPYIARGTAEDEGAIPAGSEVDVVPTTENVSRPVVPAVEEKPQPVAEKKQFNWWPWIILAIIIGAAAIILSLKLRKKNHKQGNHKNGKK